MLVVVAGDELRVLVAVGNMDGREKGSSAQLWDFFSFSVTLYSAKLLLLSYLLVRTASQRTGCCLNMGQGGITVCSFRIINQRILIQEEVTYEQKDRSNSSEYPKRHQ